MPPPPTPTASERLRISRDRIARRTHDLTLPSSPTPTPNRNNFSNSPRAPTVDGGAFGGDGDAMATTATAAGPAITKRVDDAGDAIVDMGWGEAGAWPLSEKVWGSTAAAAVPDLVKTSTPLSVFNAWDTLMPDGHGATLAQFVVREPLALDAWGNIPANAALLAAAAAVSSASCATIQGKSSSSAWQEAAGIFSHRAEINAQPPSAAHPASLAVAAWAATTGGNSVTAAAAMNNSTNSVALRSALREALTSFDANSNINFSTPTTSVLDDNADAAALVKAIADIQPHSIGLGLAPARPNHICVGTSAVTPGAESRDRGALDASPWSVLVDLRRDARALIAAANHKDGPPTDATKSSITAATSVLAVPLPLLHVSRAIVLDTATSRDEGMGGGGDAASAKEIGAQLRVRVGGIAFRDHPLFSREDWAASALRGAFQEYSRRMIIGGAALARVDARLAALLANALRSGEGGGGGGGGGGGTGYDFDGDSLSDLAARAAAVLELLSIRHDEVTSAADVMRRVAVRAASLEDARIAAGFKVTPLRLEAREVPLENAGMVASQPRLYAILLAAGALFEVLASRATSAAAGMNAGTGRASSAARSSGGGGGGGGATDSENDTINETRRLRFAISDEVPSSLIATADRLVTEFRSFQRRIKGGEEEHGRGYACGGVGSGVSDDAGIVALCTHGEAALASATGSNFPGAREFLLFLRADVECDATVPIDKLLRNALPPAEIRRRATIARTQVIVKIAVNGRDVAESMPTTITLPGFTVIANLDVSLRLRRRPTTLSVRIVEANSIARWLGGAPMAEVLVPVPGAADDAGARVWGVGRSGAGNKLNAPPRAAAAAVVPVSGFFGFSASTPMSEPSWIPEIIPSNTNTALQSNDAEAIARGAPTHSLLGFTHQRLLAGDVGCHVSWEPVASEMESYHDGEVALLPPATVSAGTATNVGDRGAFAIAGAIVAAVGRTMRGVSVLPRSQQTHVGIVQHNNNSPTGGGEGSSAEADLLTDLASVPVPRAAFMLADAPVISSSSSTADGLPTSSVGDFYATSRITNGNDAASALPPPPPTPSRGGGGGGGGTLLGRSTVNYGNNSPERRRARPSQPLSLPGSTVDNETALIVPPTMSLRRSSATLTPTMGENGVPKGFPGATLRESQRRAAVHAAVGLARASLSATSLPTADPNDPRTVAMVKSTDGTLRGGPGASRWGTAKTLMRGPPISHRFRVTALPRALSLFTAAGGGGVGLGSSAGEASGLSGLAGLLGGQATAPLPGRARLALLRLRVVRPELFAGRSMGVPLSDGDIARAGPLRSLLRDALISLGVGAVVPKGGSVKDIVRAGAAALRIPVSSAIADGQPGTAEWAATGGSSATAAVSARLIHRIKDFLVRARQLAARGGMGGDGRTPAPALALSGIVHELSAPLFNVAVVFARLQAMIAPQRRLRPKGIDFAVLRDGPGSAAGDAGALARDSAAASAAAFDYPGGAPPAAGAEIFGYPETPMSGIEAPPAFRINIQVVSARNVPMRRRNGTQEVPINVYLEARFKREAQRTSHARGSNPQWNQLLSLGFTPAGGDASPARLAQELDDVTLSLFDEETTEARVDERDLLTTVLRRERRFLGSITVPFQTLLTAGGKILADIPVDVPSICLGYSSPDVINVGPSSEYGPGGATRLTMDGVGGVSSTVDSTSESHISSADSLVSAAASHRRGVFVYVNITVDPALPAESTQETHGKNSLTSSVAGPAVQRFLRQRSIDTLPEGRALLERASKFSDYWSRPANGPEPPSFRAQRIVSALVENSRGDLVLICRYLTALPPPPDAATAVAHYAATLANAASSSATSAAGVGANGRNGAAVVLETSAPAQDDEATVLVTRDFTRRSPLVDPSVARCLSLEVAYRFTMLLPNLSDANSFGADAGDVWCTVAETLDMGAGDAEEHALMLANYFMWFDKHAPDVGRGAKSEWATYILLALTADGGEAVWVLRQDTLSIPLKSIFVDPTSGRTYLDSDESCPLRAIGTVASATNVWANIQVHTHPSAMNWDFNNVKAWAPLFTDHDPFPSELVSVQTMPFYRVPDISLCGALERDILGSLANQLRAWRPRFTTRIRNDVSSVLRPLLLELEARKCGYTSVDSVFPSSDGLVRVAPGAVVDSPTIDASGHIILPPHASRVRTLAARQLRSDGMGGRDLEAEHASAIKAASNRYTAHGFPLNMTFTSLENVLRRVKATRLHTLEEEIAQFAIAVLVVPYPNDIFSVWVYMISLMPLPASGPVTF